MFRTALFIAAFIGLLASDVLAAPATTQTSTLWWRPRGFRSHRASQGDYVPVYASYRNRTRYGVFGFLHRSPGAHHKAKQKHINRSGHVQKHTHTLGIF
jgi:hypothetical protein